MAARLLLIDGPATKTAVHRGIPPERAAVLLPWHHAADRVASWPTFRLAPGPSSARPHVAASATKDYGSDPGISTMRWPAVAEHNLRGNRNPTDKSRHPTIGGDSD